MAFRGLFVGIDRYRSPRVSNLTCATRDAAALYGLFADGFGEANSVLLLNEEATSAAIRREFEDRLSRARLDDIVVIAFSGHGSDCHRLVTHDADPSDIAQTTIPLDELTRLFARIPARNVILILDCCFAGGAGAKVFHEDVATKGVGSISEVLGHISGTGRVILTAAKPDQEAIEDRRRGHGLLTFHLLEGLRGAQEVLRDGRIPLLSLVDFVTRRVIASAKQVRHDQEPGIRGTLDGEVTLPVLKPGTVYSRFFSDTPNVKVGASVDGLAAFGFSSQLLKIWKDSIPSLNSLQQAAINDFGLLNGSHLVVSAPTSSGKTMVGELAALHAFLKRQRTYFLLPLRALVNDKYEEFRRKYGDYGLKVIRSTGEIADDDEALVNGKFDIALLTYERFAAMILGLPHLLRQIGLVVVDEVQMIGDRNRGATLEFLLTLLRTQREIGIEPQLVVLSAVIGDSNGLENWLGARLLRSEKRPVPLEEGIIDLSGVYRFIEPEGQEKKVAGYIKPEYRKGSSQDVIIPLLRKLVGAGEKVIVFRETKPIVQATARYLRDSLALPPAEATISALPAGDPSAASQLLKECLAGGIAFHNADLDREERRVIEESFRDPASGLQVIVATTTLAMGINTPAWSVVISGLNHPDGPYSVAEYKNIIGRAGRLGFTPKGKSFLVAISAAEVDQQWENYVQARPEDLESRFAGYDPMSLICRILATAAAARLPHMKSDDMLVFIENSFAAHQVNYRRGRPLWSREQLSEALYQLNTHKLIREDAGGYQLTELGRVAGEAGIEAKSILRLVDALDGVALNEITASTLIAAAQVTEELDSVLFPVHKKSRQEHSRWQAAMREQRIAAQTILALRSTVSDEAHYTLRCKKVASTLMWIQGMELIRIEQSILRHLPADNAAGPIRAVAERTRDLIPIVARVAEVLTGESFGSLVDKLILRLELGLPADAVRLGQILRRSLNRADYLALAHASLLVPGTINTTREEELLNILRTPAKVQALKLAAAGLADVRPESKERFQMPAIEIA